jgi:hypothetical protein
MLNLAIQSAQQAPTQHYVVDADGLACEPVAVCASSFADAAAAFLETAAAPLEAVELSVTVEDVATGERQAFVLDVA